MDFPVHKSFVYASPVYDSFVDFRLVPVLVSVLGSKIVVNYHSNKKKSQKANNAVVHVCFVFRLHSKLIFTQTSSMT